ncbi:phasin-related domain-containing protein [Photobacterium chitinilyticum]|uniref:Poly(3-hydroxyalkanoate) granule-associated protein PhaI n=1 Tax=Photobacterium chitinilyticum TaxID=2485123 RepID=A0A444JP92_9GAMM|nr:phasin family protein [Photobacterium chitinilyticum]RWX54879.1 hypothetical protein EDI28_14135 [Photobacterium chitinilyticum]
MNITKAASDESREEKKRYHSIWLAGLGAYAKSVDEIDQLSGKSKNMFNELVEDGRSVESEFKERIHTTRIHTSVSIEERAHQLVQRVVGIDNDRLDRIDDKIDQLTVNIEALLARRQAK